MSAPSLAEEFARHQETWTRWLEALSRFAAETDPIRSYQCAAEVRETMPGAFRARLAMVELWPLEMRRRELEACLQNWALRLTHAHDGRAYVSVEEPNDDGKGGKS